MESHGLEVGADCLPSSIPTLDLDLGPGLDLPGLHWIGDLGFGLLGLEN